MEKLQKNHIRWLKNSSSNYKKSRWDIFAKEWAIFALSPSSRIQMFVNICLCFGDFLLLLWPFVTVSVEVEWDHMVDESASITIQLLGRSQSAVNQSVSQFKLCVNYVMLIAGKFYGMMLLQSFNVFYGFRKSLCFIENWLSYFLCFLKLLYMLWYSMSFWNQMYILCWKDILIFMTILSLPVNHEHWDCTSFIMVALQ